VFRPPVSDAVELSYLAAMFGSVASVVVAIYQLARRQGAMPKILANLLLALAWCLLLAFCFFLMAVRTGI
jgi:hypothetical protein